MNAVRKALITTSMVAFLGGEARTQEPTGLVLRPRFR